MLHGGPDTPSPFKPLIVSADGQPFEAGNGVRITPDASFADCPQPDIAVVTDLMIPPGASTDGLYDAGGGVAARRLRRRRHAGVGLLGRAAARAHRPARRPRRHVALGVLRRAAREYPRTRWHAERGLVVAGDDQRIVMAGSGVAWHLLVLALIARFASPQDAMQVARINLLDLNAASPLAYASLTHGAAAADALVARCQHWAASNYHAESPVAQMVALSGLPERTFKRRFVQATGMAPLDYVHTLRLEEAKQMLEASELPVEAIALEVGYQDASFFGRLFRRKVALTPAQYRRRFGALNTQLRRACA